MSLSRISKYLHKTEIPVMESYPRYHISGVRGEIDCVIMSEEDEEIFGDRYPKAIINSKKWKYEPSKKNHSFWRKYRRSGKQGVKHSFSMESYAMHQIAEDYFVVSHEFKKRLDDAKPQDVDQYMIDTLKQACPKGSCPL